MRWLLGVLITTLTGPGGLLLFLPLRTTHGGCPILKKYPSTGREGDEEGRVGETADYCQSSEPSKNVHVAGNPELLN